MAIVLSLLMSVVQLGTEAALPYATSVTAVFEAATRARRSTLPELGTETRRRPCP